MGGPEHWGCPGLGDGPQNGPGVRFMVITPGLSPLLNGVYTAESPFARPVFHPAAELEDAEVVALVRTIRTRAVHDPRALRWCFRLSLVSDSRQGDVDGNRTPQR